MTLRAVVSDFGGVLTSPLIGSFAKFQDEAGLPPEALGEALAGLTDRHGENPLFALERGEMSERDFLGAMAAELEERLGRPVPMHEFTDRYWAELQVNEPMLELLHALRVGGIRLALLTNNVREWEPRWRPRWRIDELFELVVDSAFVGMRKPDRAIYELTVERLGVPAEACVFIDDLEVNCDAARDAGMIPVHFRETEQAIAEVRALLGR
jgi:putative hydrolase of the HAD superfamily